MEYVWPSLLWLLMQETPKDYFSQKFFGDILSVNMSLKALCLSSKMAYIKICFTSFHVNFRGC